MAGLTRVVLQADVAADGRRNMSVERDGDDLVTGATTSDPS